MNKQSGQTFLTLIFLIGGIVALVGITLAFLASAFIDSGYGYKDSVIAETTAQSGLQDALLRLDRNPSFSNTSGYSLPVGSNTATVTVTQNSPVANEITILSQANAQGRVRKIQVVVGLNASSGQMNIISDQEIQ